MSLPTDPKARKATPIVTGCMDYFPLALAAIARLSKKANDKHNPGQPMHWSRGKSDDHADCLGRHLLERGQIDPETGESFTVHTAWRSLALLQIEEEERLGLAAPSPALALLAAHPEPGPLPPIGPAITAKEPPLDEPE